MRRLSAYQLNELNQLTDVTDAFEVGIFPGGEPYVKLSEQSVTEGRPILICLRFRGAVDLMVFCEAVRAAQMVSSEVHGFVPYFPAARQDRETRNPLMPLSVRLYADIVNHLGLKSVSVLDPHSPVTPALLDRVNVLPVSPLCVDSAEGFAGFGHTRYNGVIAPDAGAEKRANEVASTMGAVPVFSGGKRRDTGSGALTGFRFDENNLESGRYLLVDDICDGGGTFAGLLAAIRKMYPEWSHTFDLWVTHGVFSGKYRHNLSGFDRVMTTDSVCYGGEFYEVVELIPYFKSTFEAMLRN